jgi:hypothetical protein
METTKRGWSERWSPLGGLLFVIGFIVLLALNPDSGETPEEVIKAAHDKENLYAYVAIFALVSIPLIIWFVSGLHAKVRRMESNTAPGLVMAGGTGFALLFFVSMEIFAAPFLDFPGKADPTAAANAFLVFDDFGWVTLGGAGVAFALMALSASVAALKAGAVPKWLGWLGAIVGVLAAATITFFGIFAWLAWILVYSLLALIRRG